jgi:hypothetical protein
MTGIVKVEHVRALCANSQGRTVLVLAEDGLRLVDPDTAATVLLQQHYLDLLCTSSNLLDDGLRPHRDGSGRLVGPTVEVCAWIAEHLNAVLRLA